MSQIEYIHSAARRRFLGSLAGAGAGCLLPVWSNAVAAGSAAVKDLRMAVEEERTRLVLDLGDAVEHSVFTLSDPHRVVIDLSDTEPSEAVPSEGDGAGIIRRIRSGARGDGELRIVLDLEERGRPRSFLLDPSGDRGHRLVVDIETGAETDSTADEEATDEDRPRDLNVVIDPGHGGHDPGAIGPAGSREKVIVLQIAERLRAELDEVEGIKPIMVRSDDRFLALRDRIRFARDKDADLFLSLHADAFHDQRAKGSSVYALSLNGASSEAARWVADSENAADFLGGISLENRDEQVQSVLLDLSQSASIESSLDVGEVILGRLANVGEVHKRTVQQAGFVVLKSPDVPSLLVETAFISNPQEERKLNDATHQANLARAMRLGVENYFARKAPPGTVISEQRRKNLG